MADTSASPAAGKDDERRRLTKPDPGRRDAAQESGRAARDLVGSRLRPAWETAKTFAKNFTKQFGRNLLDDLIARFLPKWRGRRASGGGSYGAPAPAAGPARLSQARGERLDAFLDAVDGGPGGKLKALENLTADVLARIDGSRLHRQSGERNQQLLNALLDRQEQLKAQLARPAPVTEPALSPPLTPTSPWERGARESSLTEDRRFSQTPTLPVEERPAAEETRSNPRERPDSTDLTKPTDLSDPIGLSDPMGLSHRLERSDSVSSAGRSDASDSSVSLDLSGLSPMERWALTAPLLRSDSVRSTDSTISVVSTGSMDSAVSAVSADSAVSQDPRFALPVLPSARANDSMAQLVRQDSTGQRTSPPSPRSVTPVPKSAKPRTR
ncbi:hypothetical protein ACIPJQ_18965 [Streptomyces griseoviridis]